jgi:hypothetical protein
MISGNQEYLNYRIEQAFETLNAAKVLINNRFWNSSVNRLYYACFYYNDFFDLSEDAVTSMVEPVEELLDKIKIFLVKE